MIPVKLTLRNFMPYRDNVPPLDFSGIHTASICGDNGNGKSALIDAMTWALWGKTRARSDDDLVHSGQAETEVEFDFAIEQQRYRIIRKHSRPRTRRASGRTILEFQVATNGGFKSITGDSVQQTQQEIIKVLHMDYPTFINSALLLQGRADEFTISNPARRKQVLADILRLSLYDRLEDQAKELARQKEAEKALVESAIREIGEELARKPAYEAELEKAQGELLSIEKTMEEQESRLGELRQKRELLKNKQWQLTKLEEHMAETTGLLTQWEAQVKQHGSRIKEYEELMARRSAIEGGYARFIEAKQLNEELNQKFRLNNALNERKHQLEMTIVQSSQVLLKEHALVENKIGELEASIQRLPRLKNELQQAQARLEKLAGEEKLLSEESQKGQQLRIHIHHLESNRARLEQEITGVSEKLDLLMTESGARCPLCETELGTDGLKLIEAKYTADKHEKVDSLKSDRAELAQRKTELAALDSEISRMNAKLSQEKTLALSKAELVSQEIDRTREAERQLTGERTRIAEIEEQLAKKDFAASEQESLQRLEAELARLDYDPQRHEEVHRHLTDLEQFEDPRRRLEEADRLIDQEKEATSRAGQAVYELNQNLEAGRRNRDELVREVESLSQLSSSLAQAEAEHQALRVKQRQAQEVLGSVKGMLQRCSELEKRKKEREKLLNQTSREENVYRDLAQAFGKRGIQALLIEMALPEIEAEANKLLGRMTDSRMHVTIETQRETKKGDVIETLDINIADELGTRNYEMFSGGEAFRINFAIRIALSKLLAKRAGAPLPTLIIDEGFGTQDSTGLEKLKEAIISIQDDFEKLIVITHIEELRDAFPARIDVIKTAEGSTIEVS